MPQRTHAGYSGAWILFAAVVLIAGIAAGFLLLRDDEDAPGEPLEVTWAVVDGQPICAYDDPSRLVTCNLSITGNATQDEVMVTVTAWADENMVEAVGSATQPVPVEGDEDRTIEFTVPVRKAPHVDADHEAFCSIEVEYCPAGLVGQSLAEARRRQSSVRAGCLRVRVHSRRLAA